MAISASTLISSVHVAGNASLEEAKTVVLLEEHNNTEHARWHANIISKFAQDDDLLLIEDEGQESRLDPAAQKKLKIKLWDDREGIERAVILCQDYWQLYLLGLMMGKGLIDSSNFPCSLVDVLEAQKRLKDKIDQHVTETFPERQDYLIKTLSKELNTKPLKHRRIFVIAGRYHGDIKTSPFPAEVQKLIHFLNGATNYCIYNPLK